VPVLRTMADSVLRWQARMWPEGGGSR